jgi:hypothetical protein
LKAGKHTKDTIKAHHEAGHAVVARKLGVAITRCTMFSTDPTNEAAAHTHSAAWLARDAALSDRVTALETDAKIALAGQLSEMQYHPPKDDRLREEWRIDINLAKGFIAKSVLLKSGADMTGLTTLGPQNSVEAVKLLERLWNETDVLIRQNWPAIERTADALLRRRHLTGDDVDALIDAVESSPPAQN